MIEILFNFIGDNLIYFLHLEFLIFFFFIILNIEDLKKNFSSIDKRTWIILIIIITIGSLLSVRYIGKEILIEELTIAKEFLLGGDIFYKNLTYGPGFPYLVSLLFILKIDPSMAFILNFLFFILSLLGMFLLSYLITKNESVSLLSSLIYIIFYNQMEVYTMRKIFIESTHFFIIYFFIFSFYALKSKKTKSYFLALIFIFLAALTRLEYTILIPIFFLGFIIFNLKDIIKLKKIENLKKILPSLIVLLLIIPHMIILDYNNHRQQGNPNGFPNYDLSKPSYIIEESFFWFKTHSFSDPLYFFQRGIKGFLDFIFSHQIITIIILGSIGSYFMFKLFKKETFFLISSFVIITVPYLFCAGSFSPRYGFYTIVSLIPLTSYGIYSLIELVSPKQKKIISTSFLIILIIILLSNLNLEKIEPDFLSKDKILNEQERKMSDLINSIEGGEENKDIFIITSKTGRSDRLEFETMKFSISLQDLIRFSDYWYENLNSVENSEEIRANTEDRLYYNQTSIEKVKDRKIELIKKTITQIKNSYSIGEEPMKLPNNNTIYFLEYPECDEYLVKEACDIITDNYKYDILFESKGYILYKIN